MLGSVARRRTPVLLAGAASALAIAAVIRGRRSLRERFRSALAEAGLPAGPGDERPVTEAEIEGLPDTVRRYLRFMGVVGRPRAWSFRAASVGRFRLGPERPWLPCDAWQYNTCLDLARIFHIRIRFGGVVPVVGRDTYLRSRGRMLIRLFDRFPVEDASGPEYDTSELVTYLNDAIMLAPSMLLGPETTWSAVDDGSFDVALTDSGRTVSARAFVDESGAPQSFSTTDRFLQDPYDAQHRVIRAQWTTPVSGWDIADGHRMPVDGQAVWRLPQGDFSYAELRVRPDTLEFNVRPGPATRARLAA